MGFDGASGNRYEAAPAIAQQQRETELLQRRNAQLEEQVRALLVLQDVANTRSAEIDLPSLLRRFAMAAVRLSSADVGAVYLVDSAANALVVEAIETSHTAADSGVFSGLNLLEVAHSGPREMIPRAGRPQMPMGEGLAGRVAASSDFILVPDVSADTRFSREVLARDIQVLGGEPTSLLVVPIVFRGHILGCYKLRRPEAPRDSTRPASTSCAHWPRRPAPPWRMLSFTTNFATSATA